MKKKVIHLVAGARPNFMKIAPLYHLLKKTNWGRPEFIHTGQHSNHKMSGVFLKDLLLPKPKHQIKIFAKTHAEQTAKIMISYEKICLQNRPDLVIVVGDVNSTLAATLAAKKIGVRVVHLEAGLRSGDRAMPEELNRIVVDSISDLLLTPSRDADKNLIKEGVSTKKIKRVGNIMIDNIINHSRKIKNSNILKRYNLKPSEYIIVTLHRPANVDTQDRLKTILNEIKKISETNKVIWPLHPRLKVQIKKFKLDNFIKHKNLIITNPLGYFDFLKLTKKCGLVITDSGGIQEETTFLGKTCITVRETTERPLTLTKGENFLCDIRRIKKMVDLKKSFRKKNKKHVIPMWDGKTGPRVLKSIKSFLKAHI